MRIEHLILIFLTLLVMPLAMADYDPSEDNAIENSSFLQKLRATNEVSKRVDLVINLEKKPSEKTRKTLEVIALDTKEAGEVRMQAVCTLGGMANSRNMPVLLDILETDMKQRRGFWACAIPALGALKDRKAIPLLIRVANQREEHLAGMDHMAIEALAQIGDEREVTLLASKMSIAPVRLAIVKGLARIASVKSTEFLVEALQGAEEPEVVIAAQEGLLKIGKTALPILKKTLEVVPESWDKIYVTRLEELILKISKK